MREEQEYKISRRAQLIDLNKDHTNFKLQFECHATPDVTYQVCVTNQTELDSKDISELEMRTVEGGTISGNIVADSDVYQNYFLVLRSENEIPVQVVIDIEPIDPAPPSSVLHDEGNQSTSSAPSSSSSSSTGNWLRILFGVMLLLFFLVIVYYIFQLSETRSSSPVEVLGAGAGKTDVVVAPAPSVVDEILSGL